MNDHVIEAYPLTWPTGWKRTKNPKTSRFGRNYNSKPSVAKAIDTLSNELRLFGARNLIVSSNLKLKNDGLPYSNQKIPEDTGIAVYFSLRKEQQVIACDTFNLPGCNIYAIALTIQSLRSLERYGASEILNKAFSGFKALPEKAGPSNLAWWTVLGLKENCKYEEAKSAFRKLSKLYHPDTGDDTGRFYLVNEAFNNAKKHFEENT